MKLWQVFAVAGMIVAGFTGFFVTVTSSIKDTGTIIIFCGICVFIVVSGIIMANPWGEKEEEEDNG